MRGLGWIQRQVAIWLLVQSGKYFQRRRTNGTGFLRRLICREKFLLLLWQYTCQEILTKLVIPHSALKV